MNIVEAAQYLMNSRYANNMDYQFARELEDNNLVVVQGQSDDLMILSGAIYDEYGGGTTIYFKDGKLLENKCIDDDCPYFKEKMRGAKYVKPVWNRNLKGPCWYYETNIPYATFNVYDDGLFYCRGIVFSLGDT